MSLKEITDRIDALTKPFSKLLSLNVSTERIGSNNIAKAITLNRQCERFLYDLMRILLDHQMYIERCLKNFRSQLNKIHEIVKFRTAIPITSIFVSTHIKFRCFVLLAITRIRLADVLQYNHSALASLLS